MIARNSLTPTTNFSSSLTNSPLYPFNPFSQSSSPMDRVEFRTQIIRNHLRNTQTTTFNHHLTTLPCINYLPQELTEPTSNFDTHFLSNLLNGTISNELDYLLNLMKQSTLYCPRNRGGVVFIGPDYNTSMEEQREMTMKRLEYLRDNGAFDGWFAKEGYEGELWRLAMAECISFFDHSLAIKLGVHFVLWYGFGLSIIIVSVRMIFLATISSYLSPCIKLGVN